MGNKTKQFFSSLWQKVRPYISYILAFLSGLIGLLILGKKRDIKHSEVFAKDQEKRNEQAAEIGSNADQILQKAMAI